MEQQALHDLQAGKTGQPALDAATQMIQTPLPVLMCPTRRTAVLYPVRGVTFAYSNAITWAARADYAGNGGDVFTTDTFGIYHVPMIPTFPGAQK